MISIDFFHQEFGMFNNSELFLLFLKWCQAALLKPKMDINSNGFNC